MFINVINICYCVTRYFYNYCQDDATSNSLFMHCRDIDVHAIHQVLLRVVYYYYLPLFHFVQKCLVCYVAFESIMFASLKL